MLLEPEPFSKIACVKLEPEAVLARLLNAALSVNASVAVGAGVGIGDGA